MNVTVKQISELKRPEKNIRMHTDKQLVEFRRSVEMFGQIRPIVCDENGVILAGNGLYETLLSMGKQTADCYVVTGLSEKEKKKLMLADNRIFDLGVDDMKAFDEFIAELGDDLDVPGYDDELLRSLVADTEEIDEMMSSYGIVPEERKAEIATASNEQREVKSPAAPEPEETQPVRHCVCDSQRPLWAKKRRCNGKRYCDTPARCAAAPTTPKSDQFQRQNSAHFVTNRTKHRLYPHRFSVVR